MVKIEDGAPLHILLQKSIYIPRGLAGSPILFSEAQLNLLIWSASCLPVLCSVISPYDLFYFMQAHGSHPPLLS